MGVPQFIIQTVARIMYDCKVFRRRGYRHLCVTIRASKGIVEPKVAYGSDGYRSISFTQLVVQLHVLSATRKVPACTSTTVQCTGTLQNYDLAY